MKCNIFFAVLITFYCSQVSSKTCLTEYTNTRNFSFQKEPYTGQHINAWIVTDAAPTYNCFNDRTNIKKRLSIRNRYRVLQDNYRIRSDGKYWSMLVNTTRQEEISSKTMVGWISHDHIIVQNRPMKNLDTDIFQKVLIKEGDSNNLKALRIYNDCELKYSNEGIEVRTVFYVFDFFPRAARTPDSEDTISLLIGVNAQLNTMSTNSPLLLGWIDKKRVTFWNSRTACEFKMHTQYKLLDDDYQPIFLPDMLNSPLHYNELRNPILSSTENFYKIGAFSKLSDEQLGMRKKIESIKTGLEVLFIIDGTRSMTHAFNETSKAIDNVSKQLINHSSKIGLENPRFALMIYRNIPTGLSYKKDGRKNIEVDHEYCKEEFSLFPMGNYKRLLNKLSNHVACDSNSSFKKSLYLGIIKGVKECNFDTGADGKPKRLRTIIHIGAAGDNGRRGLTAKKVSKVLQEYFVFRYISVNVSGSNSSDFNNSIIGIKLGKNGRSLHYNQIDNIAPFIVKNLKTFVEENASRLHEQLQIISNGFTLLNKTKQTVIKHRTGDIQYNAYGSKGIAGTTEGRIGVVSDELLRYARNVIHANNISLAQYNAFQQYVEGYVAKRSPLKKCILVSKTDIEKITTSLTYMIESLGNVQQRKEVWDSSLKIILGDQTCIENGIELSLEDCNKQRNGIPIKAGFMRYTKKQFLNLSGQALERVFCEAMIAREQFRAFMQNKYIKTIIMSDIDSCTYTPVYEEDINRDGKILHSEGMIDRYFFTMGSGMDSEQMAWIPLDHFTFIGE